MNGLSMLCRNFALAAFTSFSFTTPNVYAGESPIKQAERSFHIPLAFEATASATLEANKIRSERLEQGKNVYDWGLGANPMPVPEKVKKAVAEQSHEKSYGSPRGIPELAELIASNYSLTNYPLSRDNVIVAPGLKQLINDVQLAFAGPIVHISPYWVSYEEQVRIHNKEAYKIETSLDTGYKVTPSLIDNFVASNPALAQKTKLVIFNHPTNPTGVAYTREEIQNLARSFEEHNFIVFADEVYLGNTHDGQKESIAEWIPKRTIRASSISKEFGLGGYRLGWATFPDALKPLNELMFAIGTSAYSCASKPAQYAAIAALSGGAEIETFLDNSRIIFDAAAKALTVRFQELSLHTVTPNAAWYFLLDFKQYAGKLKQRGIAGSEDLCQALAKELGMIFVPGKAFGLSSSSYILRGSFVDFKPEEAIAWVNDQPKPFNYQVGLNKPLWMSKMMESTEKLEAWLRGL